MSKRQAPPSSGNLSLDSAPPFLPLEETMQPTKSEESESSLDDIAIDQECSQSMTKEDDTSSNKNQKRRRKGRASITFSDIVHSVLSRVATVKKYMKIPDRKQITSLLFGTFFIMILWESFLVEPENRLLQPDFSDKFLTWVQQNPALGLGAILIVIAGAVVSLIPIGTPLTLACGYIYRGVYGWKLGLFVSTVVSMAGSALGAVICFLLGRYLIKDTVKRWVRNYPLFDAIDVGKYIILEALHGS